VKKGKTKLLIGVLLLAAGVTFAFMPNTESVGGRAWSFFLTSMVWLWPLFLICMGVVRVMGFAVERKPRSPLGGTLLIFVGLLFFVSRFHSDLNALRIYGRYWLVLLAIYAGVELLGFYSHRNDQGQPPRLFTPVKVGAIALIVITGVMANRVAVTHPSLLSALKLPGFLSGIRDSMVGQTYWFTDEPIVLADAEPGLSLNVANSFGDVKITAVKVSGIRATLTKGVRAWNEPNAKEIAKEILLNVNRSQEGISISTNRNLSDRQFTTNIQIEIPASVKLKVTSSYGAVTVGGIIGSLLVTNSYGRAQATDIAGDLRFDLSYSDLSATGIDGNVTAKGVKKAQISGVTGEVNLEASNGSVELRDISGPVRVQAPFSRIVASGLSDFAHLETSHSSVQVARAGDLIVKAPHSDVRLDNVRGDLEVSSSNSDIQLKNINGAVTVAAERSSVVGEEIRGPVEIETSHGAVTLKKFQDEVRVRTSYREVVLVSASQPPDNIDVENDRGEIKVVFPQDSQVSIDAISESGRVKPLGFGNGLQQKVRDSFVTAFGSEGPTIKLRTSFKTITIQATGSRNALADRNPN
jgi:DUF4097 and DUF4098 domain-containing protein YvlB